MRGRYKIQIAEGWKCNVFFPNKRMRFARADKAVALQYHKHQRMWRFYPKGSSLVDEHKHFSPITGGCSESLGVL